MGFLFLGDIQHHFADIIVVGHGGQLLVEVNGVQLADNCGPENRVVELFLLPLLKSTGIWDNIVFLL